MIKEDIVREGTFGAVVFHGPISKITNFYDDDEDGEVVCTIPGELSRPQCIAVIELLNEIKDLKEDL